MPLKKAMGKLMLPVICAGLCGTLGVAALGASYALPAKVETDLGKCLVGPSDNFTCMSTGTSRRRTYRAVFENATIALASNPTANCSRLLLLSERLRLDSCLDDAEVLRKGGELLDCVAMEGGTCEEIPAMAPHDLQLPLTITGLMLVGFSAAFFLAVLVSQLLACMMPSVRTSMVMMDKPRIGPNSTDRHRHHLRQGAGDHVAWGRPQQPAVARSNSPGGGLKSGSNGLELTGSLPW